MRKNLSSTKPDFGEEDEQQRENTRSEENPDMFHCLPVDLSRDDSELFGEAYFATATSPIERVEQTPPRVLSRNSLLGEDLVISARSSYAPNSHSNTHMPMFQRDQRGTDDGLQSVSSATNQFEDQPDDDNLIFTPCSPRSEEVERTLTPPPSVALNSNCLSPPPFVSSALQSQQVSNLSVFSGCSSKLPNSSRHTLPKPISSQRQHQSLPPRAPTNAHLRMSSMSSLIIGREISSNVEKHSRAHSTGDVSLLSALTDSDYEQVANKPISNTSNLLSGLSSQIPSTHRLQYEVPLTLETPDVQGMDINIPRSIQQPILGENYEGVNHFGILGPNKGLDIFDIDTRGDGKSHYVPFVDMQSSKKNTFCTTDFFDHAQDSNLCEYEAEAVATLRAVVESEWAVRDCDKSMKNAHHLESVSAEMTNVGSIASTDNDFVLEHGQQQNGYNHEYFSDISRKLAAFSISSKSTNNKVAQRDLSPTAYSSLFAKWKKKKIKNPLII
jgi:hypothetical protein